MSNIIQSWKNASPQLLSVLRIAAAAMFILAGTAKLFAWPKGMGPTGTGTADIGTQIWIAGILEAFGGSLLLLGLCTRPIAFILAGEMAVAYFQAHFPQSVFPTMNGGVSAALYCFIFLYISSAGPGPWSLDAAFRRSAKTGH